MFKLIDRYVLRTVATPLITALGIGLALLLAERMTRLLDFTLGKRNSFGVVFEMLAYLVPHYLGTAIPAALFLGLLFGFSRLSKSQELTAMFASGISLQRLLRPLLILAAVFSVISFAVFGWLQPHTRYAYRAIVFDVGNVDAFFLAEEGVFMQAGSRTFILDKLDRSSSSFERVFIFDYQGPNGSETLTATSGVLVPVPGEVRPVLRLNNGQRFQVERWPTLETDLNAVPRSKSNFDYADTPLGKIKKDVFRQRGFDERELTLPELWRALDNPPEGSTLDSMKAEFHRRLVNIVSMFILPILALPFAMGNPRTPRGYRMTVAMLIIVAFHQVIEQGSVAIKNSGYSPWAMLWLPTLVLGLFSFWRFYRVTFSIADDPIDAAIGWVANVLSIITGPLVRLFRRKTVGA
jgi:lipopolysaccharide export system permease protein